MPSWRMRRAARRAERGGEERPEDTASARAASRDETGAVDEHDLFDTMIDLAQSAGWSESDEPDPARAAEVAERFRSRAARADARRDLERLRARHWSGERLVEEGRIEAEWWEHPDADPYAVLGLLPGARLDEASLARRRIAQACHPDRVRFDADGTEDAEDAEDAELALRRMVAANSAYDRLRRALRPI
jgi:hypothetical protein